MEKAADGTPIITKQFLKDYMLLREEIEGEQERLATLTYKMVGCNKSGNEMFHGTNSIKDKMGTLFCIKSDLEAKIAALNIEEQEKRSDIESSLQHLVDIPQERRVIRLKYIDRMEWSEIQKTLFENRKDYYENEEKYKRLMFRIHGNALAKLNPKKSEANWSKPK